MNILFRRLRIWVAVWIFIVIILYNYLYFVLEVRCRMPEASHILLSFYLPFMAINTGLLLFSACVIWTPYNFGWIRLTLLSMFVSIMVLQTMNLAGNRILPYHLTHYLAPDKSGGYYPLELWSFISFLPCLILTGSLVIRASRMGQDYFDAKRFHDPHAQAAPPIPPTGNACALPPIMNNIPDLFLDGDTPEHDDHRSNQQL